MSVAHSVRNILRKISTELINCGIVESRLESELILMECLEVRRSKLYTMQEYELSESHMSSANEYLHRRLHREPWPYISGHKEFYGLDIMVESGVFIPRPETEKLIDVSIDFLSKKENPIILDVGTGSGCIGITIALEIPSSSVSQ